MKYEILKKDKSITIVVNENDIDIDNIDDLKEVTSKILAKGYKNISYDLSSVIFINSIGIGFFVSLHEKLVKVGGSFKISAVSPEMKKIFTLVKVDKMFKVEGL